MRLLPLILHEWTLLGRSGVVRVLVAAVTAVVVVTIGLAAGRVARAERDARLLADPPSTTLGDRTIEYLANQQGVFAILPPAPLAALTVGQSDVHPQHYRITLRVRDAQLTGDQLEHPIAMHSGPLDLSFVILYLYSLVIIGLSYDLLASDRENGTLRLLLVQGATTRRLAAGKVAARAVVVIGLPLAAAIATVLVTDVSLAHVPRLALWILIGASYGFFWLGLATHVNVQGRAPAANALTLAILWLALVVVAPSVVNLATRVWFPVPSGVQLDVAMREATRAAVAEGSRTLGRFLEDHPASGTGEDGMKQYYALLEARDRQVSASMRPLVDEFAAQRARQARAIDVLQFASPTILAQMMLTDVAGTSGHRARRFAQQADRFQESWRAHFTPAVMSAAAAAAPLPPAFVYHEEPMADVVMRTALPLVVLLTASLALVWSGIRRFARYDVSEVTWSR